MMIIMTLKIQYIKITEIVNQIKSNQNKRKKETQQQKSNKNTHPKGREKKKNNKNKTKTKKNKKTNIVRPKWNRGMQKEVLIPKI